MKIQTALKEERERNICQYGEENNKLYTVYVYMNIYILYFFQKIKFFFFNKNNVNAASKKKRNKVFYLYYITLIKPPTVLNMQM